MILQTNIYHAFGFKINSEIDLPELPEAIIYKKENTIHIKWGNLENMWKMLSTDKNPFVVAENFVLFRVEGTAIFLIENGNSIIVSPLQSQKEEEIRLYILGTCMGALLLQNRIYTLHGSVVSIDERAYGIVGYCGAGKSTLARALVKRGYKLISDDIIPVVIQPQGPCVIPSYPYQKLWEDSITQFNMDTNRYKPIVQREKKYSVPIKNNFENNILPLEGIFILNKQQEDKVKIEDVSNLRGLQELFTHTYRNFLVQSLGIMNWHFNTSVQILKRVTLFNITRPTDRFTAFELTDLIVNKIKGESFKNEHI
ncbi:aldolase [Niallia taxi]|uniref:aldolase n=1 Tax=Niallia taxi TaxID=2499688 RepID=UPI003981D5BC